MGDWWVPGWEGAPREVFVGADMVGEGGLDGWWRGVMVRRCGVDGSGSVDWEECQSVCDVGGLDHR